VPRELHDRIAVREEGDGWDAFRAGFEGALFVDLKRELTPKRKAA
jgi:hypothetical protein